MRAFMLRQARSGDIAQFERFSGRDAVKASAVPLQVVVPAFLVGELRAAFAMGFSLALPFAVIDIVVATTLTALGMFMVPPSAIALPIKLLLFVAADGWMLVAGALVASFR